LAAQLIIHANVGGNFENRKLNLDKCQIRLLIMEIGFLLK
jgi:hypothetical protein